MRSAISTYSNCKVMYTIRKVELAENSRIETTLFLIGYQRGGINSESFLAFFSGVEEKESV